MNNLPRGVHYVSDSSFPWIRRKQGSGFRFLDEKKKPLPEKESERINKLSIPPAWVEVKICPSEKGHIQAVGFDEKGRKQYIYHQAWVEYNQQNKFEKMINFGEVLPNIRETVAKDMRQHSLTRERILATIVWLLEHTFIRIGNKVYEKENQSYGLTTLRNKHTTVEGNKVKFSFKGKSGVYHELGITHPRIAQTLKECIELPGYELFQYLDEEGQRKTVDSHEVNEYLKNISGEDLSVKDFRTWGGTTKAGEFLSKLDCQECLENKEKEIEHAITQAVEEVAMHLGNTVAVCRKYYIHPRVIDYYRKGELVPHFKKAKRNYSRNSNKLLEHEYAIWTLLKNT